MKDKSYTEKIIEQPSLFDDLMRLASKAVGKGFLSSFIVNDSDHSDMIGKALYIGRNMTYHAIENEIKGIEKMMVMKEIRDKVEIVNESTFDDVIITATKAVKDEAIKEMGLSNNILKVVDTTGDHFHVSRSEGSLKFNQYIAQIESFYTETFAISNSDSLQKIDVFKCPKFELKNGVRGTIQTSFNSKEFSAQFEDKSWGNIGFMVLKGATVTQKKEIK